MGSSGCINWPDDRHDYRTVDGSGMWVYAYWLARRPEANDGKPDPYVHCLGPEYTLMLPTPAMVTSANRTVLYPLEKTKPPVEPLVPDAVERGNYLRSVLDAGAPVLAAVCLGSISKTYAHWQTGRPWYAQTRDLTRPGNSLVRRLNKLYGSRPAELVTYVDTD